MAKSKQKSSKLSLITNIQKYKKQSAGVALVVLLMLVVSVLLLNNRREATPKVTSARDLAKSSVNTNNTKDTKTSTSTSDNKTTTSPTSPVATSTKKSNTSKTTSSTPSTTTASSGGSSQPSSPSTPAVEFRIDDGPYTQVDNDYTNIGCSQSARFTFSSTLTANAAGTATYHWERSDGARTSDRQLVFGAAGMLTVTNTWDLSSDGTPGSYEVNGWQKMVVTGPNETNSKPSDAAFTLAVNC